MLCLCVFASSLFLVFSLSIFPSFLCSVFVDFVVVRFSLLILSLFRFFVLLRVRCRRAGSQAGLGGVRYVIGARRINQSRL